MMNGGCRSSTPPDSSSFPFFPCCVLSAASPKYYETYAWYFPLPRQLVSPPPSISSPFKSQWVVQFGGTTTYAEFAETKERGLKATNAIAAFQVAPLDSPLGSPLLIFFLAD